ncbi:putative MFS family arabinose efflux permease [Kribbella voronezhensis]|uniref:Putative MFS family arabinose efflux permease n=1 Tax=Kribbella voronezhensis TaxID=2512212 RepID=A0A4V6Q5Z6_9ACTN|nr:MFS transporter [Kribbella voronezhensis]TDU91423.1 putative MFS family arabinose efflux permease [Kribbella voronezhensis]
MKPGILNHPDFRRLWTADLLSQLGSRLAMSAAPLLAVITLNASTLQVSVLRTCETAAWLVLGLFAGAWVDRIRCLPVLIWSDLGRAVLYGSIPVAAWFGVLTLTQLYVVLALSGLLTVLFDVAHSSYPPRLLEPDQLLPGNARLAANHSVAAVIGAGAGGFLVQWLTAAVTLGLNALSFVWSALWLRSIRTPEPRPAPAERPNLRREIGDGLRYVFRHPLLRPIALTTTSTFLFQSASGAVMIVFLVREVHLSPSTIGLLSMIGLLGALAASWFTERLSTRLGEPRALVLACVGIGVAFLLQALTGPGWRLTWYVVSVLLAAISIIVCYILQSSIRQRLCPPELQGRVSATMSFVAWGVAPVGSLLGGLIATATSLRTTLWLSGAGALLGAGFVVFSPLRTLHQIPEPAAASGS